MTKYDINWNNTKNNSMVLGEIIEIETGSSAMNLKLVQHYCKMKMDEVESLQTAEIREVAPIPVIAKFQRDKTATVRVPDNTSIFTTEIPSHFDSFEPKDSNWIAKVDWFTNDNQIDVHFKNDNMVTHNCDYATYKAFKDWVLMGGSAGRFYNQNLRGKSKVK
jgi:hypothetical protein